MLYKSIMLAASAILASASLLPLPVDYGHLFKVCTDAGSTTYVGVRYDDGYVTTFSYGQCYPYELPGHGVAQVAVFCRSATCYGNPNPDCSGGAVPPVPLPILAGLFLPNADDWVQLLSQAATCQPNGL